MAEFDLNAAVEKGEIPNDPMILNKIKEDPTGAVFARVQKNFSNYKVKRKDQIKDVAGSSGSDFNDLAKQEPKPVVEPSPKPSGSLSSDQPIPVSQLPSSEEFLQQQIKLNQIPDDKMVLDSIRSGKVPISRVQKNYANYLAKNPSAFVATPDGIKIETKPLKENIPAVSQVKDTIHDQILDKASTSPSDDFFRQRKALIDSGTGNLAQIQQLQADTFAKLQPEIDRRVPTTFENGQPIPPQDRLQMYQDQIEKDRDWKVYGHLTQEFADPFGVVVSAKKGDLFKAPDALTPAEEQRRIAGIRNSNPQDSIENILLDRRRAEEKSKEITLQDRITGKDKEKAAAKQKANELFSDEAPQYGIEAPKNFKLTGKERALGTGFNLIGGLLYGGPLAKLTEAIPGIAKLAQIASKSGETLTELKAARVAAKALGAADEVATLSGAIRSTRAVGAAASVGRVTAEGFATGAVVGGTRSILENNPTEDVVKDAVTEGTMFAVFGNLLLPAVGAVGKLAGLRKEFRANDSIRRLAENPEVNQLAERVQQTNVIQRINSSEFKPSSPEDLAAQAVAAKIEGIKPLTGLKSAIVSNPELLRYALAGDSKNLGEALFGANGLYKNLVEFSPELSLLVKAGRTNDAIDAAQSVMTNVLRRNPEVRDFTFAPLIHNSDSINVVYANRLAKNVKDPELYPNLRSNLLNYLDDPSSANRLLVEQNSPKRFFERLSKPKFFDVRLNPQEIDTFVGDFMEKTLAAVAGKGPAIPSGIIGKIRGTDELLKTAITFNRELNRKFIDKMASNPYSFEDNFVQVDPALTQGVKSGIELRRLQTERNVTLDQHRDLTTLIQSHQQKISGTTDPTEIRNLNQQLLSFKDQQRVLNNIVSRQESSINAMSTNLKSLPEDQVAQINQYVNEVYLPRRFGYQTKEDVGKLAEATAEIRQKKGQLAEFNQLVDSGVIDKLKVPMEEVKNLRQTLLTDINDIRTKYKQSTVKESVQQYRQKFGAADNPNFVKADSELADVMHAFATSGKDLQSNYGALFRGFALLNPRRLLLKDLGHNNVLEKMLYHIQDRNAAIDAKVRKYNDVIDGIGFKPGSKESGLLQKFGEGRLKQTDPEFQALAPDVQAKLIGGNQVARGFYDGLIDSVNEVMGKNNLPQIRKRADYFLHFSETMSSLPAKLKDFTKGLLSGEVESENGFRMFYKSKTTLDANRTNFSSEKARAGLEFKDDAITGMKAYLKPALERVYYTDLIREIDTARHFAPQNMGNFLQDVKEKILLRQPTELDQAIFKRSTIPRKILGAYHQRIGKGAILFNVGTVLQNALSTVQNIAVSPLHATKAVGQMFSKEGNEAVALSKNLATRNLLNLEANREGALFSQEVLDKAGIIGRGAGKIGEAVGKVANPVSKAFEAVGGYGLKVFDRIAAKHAYLTGFSKARSMGLSQEEAARFADKWTDMIQNSTDSSNQTNLYRSTIGKSLFQFSSFVTNYAGTIVRDLPNIARTDGSARAVGMILNSVAGMSIANEFSKAAGVPEPFKMDTFIPFLGQQRFGSYGLLGTAYKGVEAVVGNEQSSRRAKRDLTRTVTSLALPGGNQLSKILNTEKAKSKNKDVRDYLFGLQPKNKKPKRSERSFLENLRTDTKEELFGK